MIQNQIKALNIEDMQRKIREIPDKVSVGQLQQLSQQVDQKLFGMQSAVAKIEVDLTKRVQICSDRLGQIKDEAGERAVKMDEL